MKFFVYHNFHSGIFLFLCHNLKDRIVDEEKKYVSGYYNDVFVEFYFQSFTDLQREELNSAYHVIYREDAVKKWFFIDLQGFGEVPRLRKWKKQVTRILAKSIVVATPLSNQKSMINFNMSLPVC